jgi:hypothetical protein
MVVLLLALSASGFAGFYLWYLTWPVVPGRVIAVHEWVSELSPIRRPRAYRLVIYEHLYEGRVCTSNRQSLVTKAGLGPRKRKGDVLDVSVCRSFPSLSSPTRPFFEGMILLAILLLHLVVAGLLVLPQ